MGQVAQGHERGSSQAASQGAQCDGGPCNEQEIGGITWDIGWINLMKYNVASFAIVENTHSNSPQACQVIS